MIIKQSLEANIIAAHIPNKIIFSNVIGNLVFDWTMVMKTSRSGQFKYSPDLDGEVTVNLLDITKLIYESIDNFTDPFDYTTTTLFKESDGYHYSKLNMTFEDATETPINVNDIAVVNGVFQTKECRIYPESVDVEIGEPPVDDDLLLNFDLNEVVV